MNPELGFLLMIAAVGVGAFGWGSAIVRALFGRGGDPAATWNLVPVRIAIGIAAFLAVGGYLVAANLGRIGLLLGWQIAGCVIAVATSVQGRRAMSHPARRSWLRLGAVVAIGLSLSYLAFGAAVAGFYNSNDDDPAYLYLAKRLLSTGGLIDPFNMRRITSYGGAELFQALSMWAAGPHSGLAIEWFFFALLTIAMVVGTSTRRFVVPGLLLVGLGVLLVRPVGVWANVAPTFSGVALSLAVFRVCTSVRRTERPRACLALCGLLLAGLLSLRLEFAIPSAIVVLATALSMLARRQALRAIAIGAGAFIVAILGWAIALQRSSGTPLFPLIAGDWTRSFPWRDPAMAGLGAFVRRVFGELGTDAAWVALIGGVVAVVATRLLSRQKGTAEGLEPSRVVLVAALVGTILQIVVQTPSVSGFPLVDPGRFDGPEILACLLFSVGMLWELAEAPLPVGVGRENARSGGLIPRRLIATGLSIAILLVSLATWPDAYWTSFRAELSDANNLVRGTSYFVDPWASEQPAYNSLNAIIPRGAHVLAAVDTPGLLDFSKYTFATLDTPGATSPPPGIPLFRGERAVYSYLRGHGFTAVVASSDQLPGLSGCSKMLPGSHKQSI